MEGFILNSEYTPISVIDDFESLIWTIRYSSAGDFELYVPASSSVIGSLKTGNYIWIREEERMMIIESIELTTDIEDGDHFIVTGRSLESILDRRIIWERTVLEGSLQDGILRLLDENIINPSKETRRISNFRYKKSTDPYILGLKINAQYYGDNLYDVICDKCEEFGIGFKVIPNFETGEFVFELYCGSNRSTSQNSLPWVVFSDSYENLLNSSFYQSVKERRNAAMIIGAEEAVYIPDPENPEEMIDSGETIQRVTEYELDGATGLERREVFVDGSSTTRSEGTEEEIPIDEYISQLKNLGSDKIAEENSPDVFEGEVEYRVQFVYKKDFFLGDVVDVQNEYGFEGRCRISEIVRSEDSEGEIMTPTFTILDEKEGT